jgi:YVTN family beta-propeller protein
MPTAVLRSAALFSCLGVSLLATFVRSEDSRAPARRPVALATSADGKWLYAANRDSGSVSVIDLSTLQVAREQKLGQRVSDLALVPGLSRLLALDEGAHELLVVDAQGPRIEVVQRLAVSPYPVSILVARGGDEATVASLWSRRLTFVSLGSTAKIQHAIDLPFAPRAQLSLSRRNRLLVADAFGGKLALVDPAERRLAETREIPGHNIRGLGVSSSGQMLLIAHQMLNDLAHSIRNDIHWGLLMSNDLRWLQVDSVLAGSDHLYRGGHMHPLGDAGRGGGDPGSLDVAADGTVVVTISGVNEVAFGKEGDFSMQRLKVGQRPTAVRLSTDGKTANIANTFDDSISVLDLNERAIVATISLGPTPELSLIQRGELLFYDARLSHDGWMSCHSCHTDGHANGQMNDNFSDRSFGAAKRVPSLLGVKDTFPLAWNGQVQSFERQIHNSVENTMQREDTLPRADVEALASYLKTLELPPPLNDLKQTRDHAAIARGKLVFERRECATCHAPPTYTSAGVFDVGLRDSQGVKEFNPPSLRGVSHRAPLFHDSRAAALEDVFLIHGHPSEAPYSPDEVADLAAYLRSL